MAEERTAAQLESGIERQISLSWKQAFTISMRNVTLRLGRAAVTGAGIVLGIAFLISVGTGRVIEEGVRDHETKRDRHVSAEEDISATAAEDEQRSAAKSNWLIVMSLLVCGVGITNSLLMSVTERFREIGTMKCLGALDEFIVRLFLIEAAVLGVLGSAVGALLGHLIVLLWGCITHGFSLPAKMNWGVMVVWLVASLGVGTIISLLAAVFPAVRAAKLPPAAALATEI